MAAEREAAELVGIRSRTVIALSFALSGGVAACAGLLAAQITTVGQTMAAALVLKAFSVAVVAGLDRGFGIVIAGVALGAIESLASFYLGSGWREAPGLALLILALAIRPQGLFGRTATR